MPFDSPTRNKLTRMVSEAKKILLQEFTGQLQEIHGIQPEGEITDLGKLVHLESDQLSIAELLRERIKHLISGMPSEKNPKATAVDRVIREQAFTVLNRFAALRLCEVRGIIQESIGQGMQSKGFQVYSTIAGSAIGPIYERYRTFLFCLFDEIAVDLGILFDRNSFQGLLFPREPALLSLLQILNNSDLKSLWTEDETIGWIYQYFNSQEERKAMRKASAAPRNSRELAVRNQFFTPRYVVEFLTDNTLGRIWYEMRKGNTALKEDCRYLVRRPNEVFLGTDEKAPTIGQNEADLSQDELLKQPAYIPHRPLKDPRAIKMLDPACGSMHFGLYAFDLFERIYEEAWDLEVSIGSDAFIRSEEFKPLHESYASREAFLCDIPRLIVEHNIHGIDIDPRAVQIAALALWLRAQRSWLAQGLKMEYRSKITRSNIVCAEPMPGDEKMRREFTENLKPRVIGQLVDAIFNKMELAGEAGSLLKIEEEIKDAVANARKQWQEIPKPEQQLLFPEIGDCRPKQQEFRFDLKGVTEEKFWGQAEDRILAALKDYAEQAENGSTLRRRLFSEDAARGFAFIDLCRRRYDVVLMNPPFGAISELAIDMIRINYPITYSNLACTFHQRISMLSNQGMIGAIVDMATLVRSSYEGYRRSVIYNNSSLSTLCFLGWNVLDDANVETCLITISCGSSNNVEKIACCDLRNSGEKAALLEKYTSSAGFIWSCQKDFESLPNGVPAFYLPAVMRSLFTFHKSFDPTFAAVCTGVSTGDNLRFYKLAWEISRIGLLTGWKHLSNGGDYCPFYRPWTDVIDWWNNGASIRSHKGAFIRNEVKFGRYGLTYGKRGEFLSVQLHPAERIITNEGQGIFPHSTEDAEAICAILNSNLLQVTINTYCGQHKENGYVKLLPIIELTSSLNFCLKELSRSAYTLIRNMIAMSIEHSESLTPALISVRGYRNQRIGDSYLKYQSNIQTKCEEANRIELGINNLVDTAYSIDETVKAFVTANSADKAGLGAAIAHQLPFSQRTFLAESLDYFLGVVLSRWDVRISLDTSLAPKLPDPFDPLPVCPPGMLVGPDGLPAEPGSIVSEEWLRARPDANTLPLAGTISIPAIRDNEYPIRISWEGILVDDSFDHNHSHKEDVVNRVREVLEVLWKDKAPEIEQEACEILGVAKLRDYFSKPSGFFEDHLKRYSKSRRKAPIYWPLSTASGSYTLWIYYHRLTDQTLFACVNDFVNPRVEEISKEIDKAHVDLRQDPAVKNRRHLDNLMEFQQELIDFKEELLRVANLPYKPDLNDGVLITACPLWKLFLHNRWRKDMEDCWKKLSEGEYEWAHLAYAIQPDRVKKACQADRSIAIAHDLESLYQGETRQNTVKRKRKG